MSSDFTLTSWNFKNSYSQLPDSFFQKIDPTPVKKPIFIKFNESLAHSLDLDVDSLRNDPAQFSGNKIPKGAEPIAQAYAGHQFGHFNMLGDGRANLLGEHVTKSGKRFDIQLKGSGPTRYARRGDGRAALGPMLREYIMSEAMFALGIPTTRSLAVISSGEGVQREHLLPGGILTRVASSHLRVGTFEFAATLSDPQKLNALADYAIGRHYPEICSSEEPYLAFLNAVMDRQALLVAAWMHVGFIHGVMNTDNVSISGETIDYGPCAFMDVYSPKTVFSSIDHQGRYAYERQPNITKWNMSRFAETLLPLLDKDETKAIQKAEDALETFVPKFLKYWMAGMFSKLGLKSDEKESQKIVESLLSWMELHQADWTQAFHDLSHEILPTREIYQRQDFKNWHNQFLLQKPDFNLMKKKNPAVIPRNYRVEEALASAVENQNYGPLEHLLDILKNPFEDSKESLEFLAPPKTPDPDYRTFCGT